MSTHHHAAPDQGLEARVQARASLKELNTLGLPAHAAHLVRVRSAAEVRHIVDHPRWGRERKFILGSGSNIVFSRDVPDLVVKVEIMGRQVVDLGTQGRVLELGAGENWAEVVRWSIEQGWPGLENLALIPGSVGAAPVQNIGAYGVELKDRFHSLDAVDLVTGRTVTLDGPACGFGYRDSIFKRALAGKSLITQVRLHLPSTWQPQLGYLDIERKMAETGIHQPSAATVFQWVCDIRRAKLPDPAIIGNVGSFFKNPVVTAEQCKDIIGRDPHVVHYPMPDGTVKLAAGWLIDACGWKGKTIGGAGVYERQALVLVNRGGATGGEVVTLARAIQESVYGRFGIRLEPEPVVI